MKEGKYSEVFILTCEAFAAEFGSPLPKKLLEIGTSEGWLLKLNNSDSDLPNHPRFTVNAEFNGWPAGNFDAFGGILISASDVNESALCEWLKLLPEQDSNPIS